MTQDTQEPDRIRPTGSQVGAVMETSFTPGPWHTDSECEHESVLGSTGFMVADCAIFSLMKGAPTQEQNQANARLISAAPDLLAALLALQPHVSTIGTVDDAAMVDAALAKATGAR